LAEELTIQVPKQKLTIFKDMATNKQIRKSAHFARTNAVLCSFVLVLFLAGCKNDEKKKAQAEAAQTKTELIKLKAENVRLKGEAGYLRDRLQTVEKSKADLENQMNQLFEDQNETATGEQTAQAERDKLKTMLAEQMKKSAELEKQVEQLKAVIREIQTKLELQAEQGQKREINEAPGTKP
jgi:hypothetical protein